MQSIHQLPIAYQTSYRSDSAGNIKSSGDELQLMTSAILHEMKNSLTLITSSFQLIEKQHPEAACFQHWQEILKDLDYIRSLLLDYSFFSNAKRPNIEPHDFTCFLKQTCESCQCLFSSPGKQLILNISETPVHVFMDPLKMYHAISNIIKNASESLEHNGKVTVSMETTNCQMTLTIRDNGCGIPKERLQSIFNPFYTSKTYGTGLGLPIAKSIIEAHSGTLSVISTTMEQQIDHRTSVSQCENDDDFQTGTSFIILLPCTT